VTEFVAVCKADDLGDGEMTVVEAGGVKIAVANLDGALYAFDDGCTHRACSLAEGDLEESSVVCPCHGGAFDLESGEVVGGPPTEPIHTYEVRVEGGMIEVCLD
jgi:nitrite reductase/ring-hydroxylating ferredoxin subunit